jgi:two-component system, sensor histidine kinase PdtaS
MLKVVFSCFFILIIEISYAQLFDSKRNPPYQAIFSVKSNFDSSYLSQLEKVYQQNIRDTLRFAIGNDLAYYWHTRNLDKSFKIAQEVFNQTLKKQNKIWQGRLQVTLGAILLRQEKLDSAFRVLESAQAKLARQDWALLLTQMGYVFERKGQLSKAADYALEGLKLGDSLRDIRTQAMAYSDLSNLFWKQSKFDQGIEYGLKSEKLFKQRDIADMDYSFTLYVIGNNYLSLKNYAQAKKYYELALAMSQHYQFYNNLADIHISLAELYIITNQYAQAETNAREAIRYSTLLENNFMLMRSWLALAQLQNLNNQANNAIMSLKTCLKVATENFGDEFYLSRAYYELGKAYSKTGDYKSAYSAFLKYDVLKDSVFTAEADQRVAKLQTEFEVAQKETTIKTQKQAIAQQKRLQWLILGAAVLLVLVLVFVYRNYRNKKNLSTKLATLNNQLAQKNSQLDKRNAENELLLKEIHHRVKNNMEIVSSLLALQAAQIDNPSAQAVMKASQSRVVSMGMIHQKLYQKGNLATIEMKDYFHHLTENILDTFGMTERITVLCPMQTIELDVDTAVPIGLIANELLTNSMKYAFAENQSGVITISLNPTDNPDELLFSVSDDGIGKPMDASAKGTGFGTELVNLLVMQLNAKLTTSNQQGTSVNIRFKIK